MGLCIPISTYQDQEDESEYSQPRQVTFNMDSALQSEEQQSTTENTSFEFLRLHYKYWNLSFKRLRRMVKLGNISNNSETCDNPTCAACMYAKSTCKPWYWSSRKIKQKPLQVNNAGQIVSVDKLVSQTPGLVVQITGNLTTKTYKYATVFVDQLSR